MLCPAGVQTCSKKAMAETLEQDKEVLPGSTKVCYEPVIRNVKSSVHFIKFVYAVKKGERMAPWCVVSTIKHGGGSVMTWDLFCLNQLIQPKNKQLTLH